MKIVGTAKQRGAENTGAQVVKAVYVSAFRGGEQAMIPAIRSGVPVARIGEVAGNMRRTRDEVMRILRISRATVGRKAKSGTGRLSPEQSERVIGLERLIGQVQVMIAESGNAKGFDAAAWIADWIERPLPALGGAKPADYLDTMVGQQLISRLLAQMQSGAYT